jgi:preprotein translocase subunit SecB
MSQPQINMQRVYLKGASLELPGAPHAFANGGNVEVHSHLDLHVGSSELEPSTFEVAVRATLTLTQEREGQKKVLAVIEGEQAGVFTLLDIPAQDLQGVLSVGCAQALFPYLRVNLADMMTRATLAPFHLPDVNFAAMFQQMQQQAAGGSAPVALH